MDATRHVVISGGSRGLGAGFIEALLGAGYAVSTFSRSRTEFVDRMATGPVQDRFFFVQADMADPGSLERFTSAAFARFGIPWAVINNAGISHAQIHATASERSIREMIETNLTGALLLARLCTRAMLRRRAGGRLVSIGSIVGLRGYRGLVTYSATKAALDGMSRALARELGAVGITVNTLAPGYLDTHMSSRLQGRQLGQIIRRTPLGRLGTVADCVPLLLFLLSDGAGFVTGQTFVVDGGFTC